MQPVCLLLHSYPKASTDADCSSLGVKRPIPDNLSMERHRGVAKETINAIAPCPTNDFL
jgi:hypothetical protein